MNAKRGKVMNVANWSVEFEEILCRYLPLIGQDQIRPEHRLAELGLDSLNTVNLLLEIEDSFEIAVPDELLVAETFATAGALWTTVERLTQAR
jgi:acyl carrier protein